MTGRNGLFRGNCGYVTLLKRKMKNEKEFFPEVPGRFLLMMERLKQGGQEGRKAGNLGDFRDAAFGIGHSRRMN